MSQMRLLYKPVKFSMLCKLLITVCKLSSKTAIELRWPSTQHVLYGLRPAVSLDAQRAEHTTLSQGT